MAIKGKNCTKGYACGASCISAKKNCRNPADGQGKNYLDWLNKNTGNLTQAQREVFASRFKSLAKSPNGLPEDLREQLRNGAAAGIGLPEGVELRSINSGRIYSFEFEGSRIELTALGYSGKTSIAFEVNDSLVVDNELFAKEQQSAIASRLARIMRWEAATAPDGSEYSTSASSEDGYALATRRAIAYETMGFSRPENGFPGSAQEGVVRNGRLEAADVRQINNESDEEIARQEEIWATISTHPAIREESRRGFESDLGFSNMYGSVPLALYRNSDGERVHIRLVGDNKQPETGLIYDF